MKKIYLLRHFKVQDKTTKKLNSQEFDKWVDDYDIYDLQYLDINLPKIDKIFVSSQNRAIKTAKYLKQDFTTLDDLVEVEAKAFISTNFKFSKSFWLIIARLLWYLNLSKSERREDTIQRAKKIVEMLENDNNQNILIISHGLFLKVLQKELRNSGYNGKIDLKPNNGVLYRFWKKDFID